MLIKFLLLPRMYKAAMKAALESMYLYYLRERNETKGLHKKS